MTGPPSNRLDRGLREDQGRTLGLTPPCRTRTGWGQEASISWDPPFSMRTTFLQPPGLSMELGDIVGPELGQCLGRVPPQLTWTKGRRWTLALAVRTTPFSWAQSSRLSSAPGGLRAPRTEAVEDVVKVVEIIVTLLHHRLVAHGVVEPAVGIGHRAGAGGEEGQEGSRGHCPHPRPPPQRTPSQGPATALSCSAPPAPWATPAGCGALPALGPWCHLQASLQLGDTAFWLCHCLLCTPHLGGEALLSPTLGTSSR